MEPFGGMCEGMRLGLWSTLCGWVIFWVALLPAVGSQSTHDLQMSMLEQGGFKIG